MPGGGLPLFPVAASTSAQRVDTLFFYLIGLSGLIILGIGAVMLYSMVKYRRRSEDEIPEQISGSNRLELTWTLIPVVLSLFTFAWGAREYLTNADPPKDSIPVYVVAKQWMWKFEHQDGQEEINELHVPVGQPVKLTMTSQDVIHSFFVPEFRVKQDVLPLRYTVLWFQATKPGKYHIFCSQYCGTNHSTMTGWVYVMEPAEYQAWLAGGATAQQSPAAVGEQLFQQYGCSGCPRPDGHGPGPSFVGLYGQPVKLDNGQTAVVDDNYLRECMLHPNQPGVNRVAGFQPIMPSFQGQLSEEQILSLIAYIRSLGPGQPGSTTSGTGVPANPPAAPAGSQQANPGSSQNPGVQPTPLGSILWKRSIS